MPNNIDFDWESFLEFSKQANVSPNFIYSEIEHLYVEPIELAKSFGSFSYLEGKLSVFKIINDPKIKIKYQPFGDGEQNYTLIYDQLYPYNCVNKQWNNLIHINKRTPKL